MRNPASRSAGGVRTVRFSALLRVSAGRGTGVLRPGRRELAGLRLVLGLAVLAGRRRELLPGRRAAL
ncbi:hypothetical protein [Actinophytocola sp.]|uniref:hypothetical protein n=1 Tax=Actinophytocola sp. TaxID=1872138 RepID=UPI002D80FB69|nr:hypothetical protein [Actinophytocola sp.]HET9140583.1 hypothetical protein [Actinophytocola sp.]